MLWISIFYVSYNVIILSLQMDQIDLLLWLHLHMIQINRPIQ